MQSVKDLSQISRRNGELIYWERNQLTSSWTMASPSVPGSVTVWFGNRLAESALIRVEDVPIQGIHIRISTATAQRAGDARKGKVITTSIEVFP